MKLLASILSLLIPVLISIPCIDLPENNTLLKLSELTHKTDAGNHQEDIDYCSPFCVCQCCQSNVLVTIPPVLFHLEGLKVYFDTYSQSVQYPGIFDFLIPPKS
jgi:hypothetical protein